MIFATRRLIRSAGWLLTPLAAWAASFFGGWVGAVIAAEVESPAWGVALLFGGAAIGALAGASLWVWGLRRAWLSALRHHRNKLSRERQARSEEEASPEPSENVS